MSTLTRGTLVSGFRIREFLGAGATGTVYLADTIESGDPVAVKVIAAGPSHDTRFRERFERECALAASLNHPNVVTTIASGETEGQLYLAMEYLEGSDLREILRREAPLAPARALGLVAQVAAALDTAHKLGLVHRDIKPGNILVTERDGVERALVCDFGLARHVSSASSLTGDRGFVGTIDYVPPEQIQGNPVDRRSDLYSLGCVLFECLVGVKPFERESEISVVFAHLNDVPPRPTEFRPELPAAWDEFFAKALAKEPSDRFGSGREFVEAAHAAAAGRRLRSRSVRRLMIAVAVTAVVAAALGAGLALDQAHGHVRPEITRTSIHGLTLGGTAALYQKTLGGGHQSYVVSPGFPTISFEQLRVAVYFPKHSRRAFLIATWNRAFRTAEGIGPCSTLAQMRATYGSRVVPTSRGQSPGGKVQWSWQLGRNLLFVTDDHKTISEVVLFKGPVYAEGRYQQPGTHQGWASYFGENGPACA